MARNGLRLAEPHVERVRTIADGPSAVSADDEIAISWRRSAKAHGVDPASAKPPRVLTTTELKDYREPLAKLIVDAGPEMDRLYKVVRRARYSILLCDAQGVAVDHRGDPTEVDQFRYWGIWLGGVWSEGVEGTNGIGTCIAEERAITVHQSQHFRARHIGLSCSGAPIFGGDGSLAAILDVSSFDPQLSEQSHALTGALTEASARAIEERFFREQFRGQWVIALAPPDGIAPPMLIAVDPDQIIVGADRSARTALLRSDNLEVSVGLWSVFERKHLRLFHSSPDDRFAELTPVGTAEPWPALITGPNDARMHRESESAALHTRPRLDTLGEKSPQVALRHAHLKGGLRPPVLRLSLIHI